MKKARYVLVVTVSLLLIMFMSGCNGGFVLDSSKSDITRVDAGNSTSAQADTGELFVIPPYEPEIAVAPTPPSPFRVPNSGNLNDFRNEIITQLMVAEAPVFNTSGTGRLQTIVTEENMAAYIVHDIASLRELYFVRAEFEDFVLTELQVDRYTVMYFFRCIEAGEWGDEIVVVFHRPSGRSPDERWQIITEQFTQDGRGHVTAGGMIYRPVSGRLTGMMGDTQITILVTDRLNNYEFLRDLALEVIATSELIVLDDILAEPVVYGVEINPSELTLRRGFSHNFSATVLGLNNPPQGVTWSVEGNASGLTRIDQSGQLMVYLFDEAGFITVRATSTHSTAVYGTARVEVLPVEFRRLNFHLVGAGAFSAELETLGIGRDIAVDEAGAPVLPNLITPAFPPIFVQPPVPLGAIDIPVGARIFEHLAQWHPDWWYISNPQSDGHVFMGWYIVNPFEEIWIINDAFPGEPVTEGTVMPNENISITPHWLHAPW
ncbi:MAG: Ig-like domain-containing protein [Oscillospiraceae bacterium]|nr:Ig-like domain-containing protein [Oscillospiraceae bacterium]